MIQIAVAARRMRCIAARRFVPDRSALAFEAVHWLFQARPWPDERGQRLLERLPCLRERHPVLRALGPGDARLHRAQIQLHDFRVHRLRRIFFVEQSLLAAVGFHQLDLLFGTPGHAQIGQRFRVHREDAAGCAVLRRHVGDGGPVGQRQGVQAGTKIFHEFPDDAGLAQNLGHGQHQVGGRGALAQFSAEAEAHHLRNQHRNRLPQHGCLGLDAAHAPAQHAQSIHHGGMRVGAHQRIGIRLRQRAIIGIGKDHARQILQIDLVHDAHIRRHDRQIAERRLSPAQKRVALAVALKFQRRVHAEGVLAAEFIHLHRVVDHQLGRQQWIDERRVAAQLLHGVAHGRQVNDRRHAGEILHQHPRRHEGDFFRGRRFRVPIGQIFYVLCGDRFSILMPQQILQQHAQRIRQPMRPQPGFVQRLQPVDLILPPARPQHRFAVEAVHGRRLRADRTFNRLLPNSFIVALALSPQPSRCHPDRNATEPREGA